MYICRERNEKYSIERMGKNNPCYRGGFIQAEKRRYLRMKQNPQRYLKNNISSLINQRLKKRLLSKQGKKTFDGILPYTIETLISHLENLFEPWMSWQNRGKKLGCWVIDHRVPDTSFNYKSVTDEEFQKCWALDNLRPMEFIANIKKGNKII